MTIYQCPLCECERLRLTCQIGSADLRAIGDLCGMRDDEYPLRAVQRVVAENGYLQGVAAAYRAERKAEERAVLARKECGVSLDRGTWDRADRAAEALTEARAALAALEGGERE